MKDFSARRSSVASRTLLGGVVATLLLTTAVLASPPPHQQSASLTAQSQAASDQAAVSGAQVADSLAVTLRTVAPNEDGRYRTIVRFTEAPLASYDGGIAGLPATSNRATGAARLDATSSAAIAYRQFLADRQASHQAGIARLLEREFELEHQFLGALNGATAWLTLDEARRVRDLDFVRSVHLDEERELETDIGPDHIGAPAIWNAMTGDSTGTRGEGIIIGVMDTGINFSHPSFAAADGDGYVHSNPYGAGVYKGWCADNPGHCNDKLIGAYSFNPVGGNPTDDNNHGSHVAATAAGNKHIAEFSVGNDDYALDISGVAPRANIVAYRVCAPSCPTSASVLAVDSAILEDQVDVLNYSISGSDSPWSDIVDLAFLDAFNAGIFVSASAGNSGPGASTVAKTGPWMASVAASTHRRVIANTLDVTGPGTPAALQGVAAVPGEDIAIGSDINGELRFNPDNPLGCTGHPAGFFTGAIALLSRGDCTFSQKVNNAVAAGATQVVVFNHVGGPPTVMGGVGGLPVSVMIDNQSGVALRDYVQSNPGATIRLNAGTSLVENTVWEDVIAGFSSRGPSQFNVLAPTFTAPGVNILAAGFNGPDAYSIQQGTSMASPHAAGAAALLAALRPDWSPAEIRSALALSSASGFMLKDDGVTPADPFDEGSGLLDLSAAGFTGLVMDESGANYAAADPAIGGDPRTLNIPHLVDQACPETCSFQRSFRSVFQETTDYTVEFSAPSGISVTVTPDSFTLTPGETVELQIDVEADMGAAAVGQWNFGELRIVPDFDQDLVLAEDFSDATFPPAGWSNFWLEGAGTLTWTRVTATSNSAPASAHRRWSSTADGFQDDWLVTPTFSLPAGKSSELRFADRGQFMADYGYSGIMASTGSCDPSDGDFVELREIDDSANVVWRDVPAIDLTAYAGQSLCLAFRYSGTYAHSWWIDDVTVTSFDPPPATARLPLAIIPVISTAAIEVVPDEINVNLGLDGQPAVIPVQIRNIGNSPLNWTIDDSGTIEGPIWHQPVNGSSGIVSDFFIGSDAGAYAASDFVLSASTNLTGIHTPGFDNSNTLGEQPAINWHIYADDNGVPAGHPEDGSNGASALWTYSAAPNAPGVDITDDDISLDLDAAGQALNLPAGTFWLSVFPEYDVTGAGGARWNWSQGAQVGAETHLVSPVIFGAANWTSLSALGVTFQDTAFTLFAPISCGAAWMSVDPSSGTVGADNEQEISLVLDPQGLAAGTYLAYLCIESNDSEDPTTVVPVTMNIVADGVFADRFEAP